MLNLGGLEYLSIKSCNPSYLTFNRKENITNKHVQG